MLNRFGSKTIKRLLPRGLWRRGSALLTMLNQRQLLHVGWQCGRVRLRPVHNVEHYYHFLFDLSLPLFKLVSNTPSTVVFEVPSFGPFSERIPLLFQDRVVVSIESSQAELLGGQWERLRGMNPVHVNVSRRDLQDFSSHGLSALGVSPRKSRKVLLVERLPPDYYFARDAAKKGGGTSRRSIVNHDEVASVLRSSVRAPFEFHNVQLERMSFREQVQCFRDARVVVAQHGAALANSIWMNPGSHVVEFSNNPGLDHFKILSRRKGHRYHRKMVSEAHASINTTELLDWLRSRGTLAEVFS